MNYFYTLSTVFRPLLMWWMVPPNNPTSRACCSANRASCNPSSPRPIRSIRRSPRNPLARSNSSRRLTATSGSKSHSVISWITGTPAKFPWIKFLMIVIGPSALTQMIDVVRMPRTWYFMKWNAWLSDPANTEKINMSLNIRQRPYQYENVVLKGVIAHFAHLWRMIALHWWFFCLRLRFRMIFS